MLIKQANQKSVLFATMGISEIKVFNFNKMSAKDAMILLMMSMNLSDIAILNRVLIIIVILVELAKVR